VKLINFIKQAVYFIAGIVLCILAVIASIVILLVMGAIIFATVIVIMSMIALASPIMLIEHFRKKPPSPLK